ncbi:alpha-hydroxy acid oxidase [Opitutaceae bacterium]
MSVLPPLTQIPPDVVAVADYEPLARERMSPAAWAYFSGGVGDEITLQANPAAFARRLLRPRVLADLKGGHTRVTLFGRTYEHPIFLAPVAYQKMAHPEGERATMLGAAAMKAGMIVSTQSTVLLEDLAREAQAPLWFQLYVQRDRALTQSLVQRTEAAGFEAIVVTVDAPVLGPRNREQRSGFRLMPGVEAVNLRGQPAAAMRHLEAGVSVFSSGLLDITPTWADIVWLRSITKLPVLVKGIMTAEDAARAVSEGVAGIVVSNHGGRTLDTLPATLDVLPEISAQVAKRVPILFDGGIRRGTDILKALALGADAVMVGRPYLYGLAVAGSIGVAHVLNILRTELEFAMALTGRATIADVDASVIRPG